MACDCIEKVNETLKEKGIELVLTFLLPSFTAAIPVQTQWVAGIKKRKKPPAILASFCSLCGSKVETEASPDLSFGITTVGATVQFQP